MRQRQAEGGNVVPGAGFIFNESVCEVSGIHAGRNAGQAGIFRAHQTDRAIAPNLAIECNAFRIPLAGGIDGTNP